MEERETDAGCLISHQSQCSQVPCANAAQKNRGCERTPHYSYKPYFIQLQESAKINLSVINEINNNFIN